jgi:hypothetical protein
MLAKGFAQSLLKIPPLGLAYLCHEQFLGR